MLFHLGIIESLLCIVFLIFSVPLLTRGEENAAVNTICNLDAFFLTLLHPIALWTVCGLNCDRYYAISGWFLFSLILSFFMCVCICSLYDELYSIFSAPLHYNAIVSSKKVKFPKENIWITIFFFIETKDFFIRSKKNQFILSFPHFFCEAKWEFSGKSPRFTRKKSFSHFMLYYITMFFMWFDEMQPLENN